MDRSERGISKLRELTSGLPKLNDLVKNRGCTHIEYDVGSNGTSIGFGLYFDEESAIQRAFGSKGAVFAPHAHESNEFIILVNGSVRVLVEDNERVLLPGDGVHFIPGEVHSLEFLKDSWLIGVVIPVEEGYPNVWGA